MIPRMKQGLEEMIGKWCIFMQSVTYSNNYELSANMDDENDLWTLVSFNRIHHLLLPVV